MKIICKINPRCYGVPAEKRSILWFGFFDRKHEGIACCPLYSETQETAARLASKQIQ